MIVRGHGRAGQHDWGTVCTVTRRSPWESNCGCPVWETDLPVTPPNTVVVALQCALMRIDGEYARYDDIRDAVDEARC